MTDEMTIEETINGLQDMIYSKKYIEHNFDGIVDEDVCERAIELLKEQEPVEPRRDTDLAWVFRCGACGAPVGYFDEDSDNPYELDNYCRRCGQEVKQNV